ncbi:ribosome recycling factor [Annulohypoxylon moriforme]|nr:ribosome recycling factor [Annulohypoxylon moriforme]
MRNTAARSLLRQRIARPELSRVQDAVLRPRLVATSHNFYPPQQRQCLNQFSASSPSLSFLNPRAFHTTTQRCKSKARVNGKGKGNSSGSESKSESKSSSDGGGGAADTPGRHPTANPEEPLDFADVESRIKWQNEHFEGVLKKLRSGGRFNPDVVGALRIQPDRKDNTTYPLKEVAQVIPRGGRTISILAHEEAYVKPIMSAVQASEDFNQQPQRVPDNELELLLKIEPETKDELVRRTKSMFTEWRDRLRSIRHKRDKQHTTWLRDRAIGPDLKRSADKELEKVIKSKMTLIDSSEKEALKAVESSK